MRRSDGVGVLLVIIGVLFIVFGAAAAITAYGEAKALTEWEEKYGTGPTAGCRVVDHGMMGREFVCFENPY
jgi:hypothetical protein